MTFNLLLLLSNIQLNISIFSYRCYMETNFSYNAAGKSGLIGSSQLFYQEPADQFDSTTTGVNPSYNKWKVKFSLSAVCQMAAVFIVTCSYSRIFCYLSSEWC